MTKFLLKHNRKEFIELFCEETGFPDLKTVRKNMESEICSTDTRFYMSCFSSIKKKPKIKQTAHKDNVNLYVLNLSNAGILLYILKFSGF